MDDAKNGVERKVRTFSTSKSDATRQGKSWTPPTNPVPPDARPRKATSAEVQTRVAYTAQMILDGRRKHEIKRFFRAQYGTHARQVEAYIRLARERLADTGDQDVAQMRAEFYQRYIRLFRESENDAIKISALRAAGDLYGLNAPQKVAQTTSGGKDVHFIRETVKGLTVDELRVLKKARARLVAAK
jgi:hypothetical protein